MKQSTLGHQSETAFLSEHTALSNGRAANAGDIAGLQLQQPLTRFQNRPPSLSQASGRALVIGLIDHYRFSRECLLRALQSLDPNDHVISYATPEHCIAADRIDLDLIIYCPHENGTPQATTLSNVAAIHCAYPVVPWVVLPDSEDALQAEASREMLASGASGFIPTRTNSIFLTIGAIRFVKEGGTIEHTEKQVSTRHLAVSTVGGQPRLTSREMTVLRLLQQGKANKIIAHELCLSENTVKIHVRNVMRKVGATNRTQAVAKARKLWGGTTREAAVEVSDRPAWCRRRKTGDRRTAPWEEGPGEDGEQ